MISTIDTAHKNYKDKDKRRAYLKEYNRKNFRKYKYGLTQEAFEAMKLGQSNVCKICKKLPKEWVVDHEHSTGRIRGLLCRSCNVAIGLLNDDPEILKEAARYVSNY